MITQITGQRVFEALFIAGLGVVWGLNFWWPGLLIDIGAAYGIALLLRERYWPGTFTIVFFVVLPLIYVLAFPLRGFVPMAVVGLGAASLVRAFRLETKK